MLGVSDNEVMLLLVEPDLAGVCFTFLVGALSI